MSFFTYYGKLKEELFVAVLPNGTVEVDDPIHVYSQKQFMSYRARDMSVTDDGEDRFTFHDGYYSFEAVTSKVYKSISLTRKTINNGEIATIVLTRHYDQPQTAASSSNGPKIWTGALTFHQWADNESFVIIAPKGLGVKKPVVALWQWTKDDKGIPKALSYGTSEQVSDAAVSGTFSFKQNGYYTLSCQVNATTKGLNVTVKGPTNDEKVQKELALAPVSELGAEHRFTPPKGRQEKVSFECSFPNAKPSLPRIAKPLPFPADLIETLSYSAAYVDQAGYLAKYAVKQFDKLDHSYHLLEKKAEARAAKITKLEGDVTRLTSENQGLTKRNEDLEKQITKEREEAKVREAALEARLQQALKDLQASETRVKQANAENEKLWAAILQDQAEDAEREKKWNDLFAKDKIEDAKRERKWKEHDEADHKALKLANKALKEAQELARELKDKVARRDRTIACLQDDLRAVECKLRAAEAEVCKLQRDLVAERKDKAEVQKKLDAAQYKLSIAEKDIAYLRTQVANLTDEVAKKKKEKFALQEKLDEALEQNSMLKIDLDAATNENKDLVKAKEEADDVVEKAQGMVKEAQEVAKVEKDARGVVRAELVKAQKDHLIEVGALKKLIKDLETKGAKPVVAATVVEIPSTA